MADDNIHAPTIVAIGRVLSSTGDSVLLNHGFAKIHAKQPVKVRLNTFIF
jgi:hypothetical protein